MRGVSVKLAALAIAFVAGWLFSNEVRAPIYADINAQVWMIAGLGGAFLMALAR